MAEKVTLNIHFEIIDGRYVLMQIGNQWNLYDIFEWMEENANNQNRD